MTAPTTLPEALARIAELEGLLEQTVTGTEAEWRRVHRALAVYPAEARLLVGLTKAEPGTGLTHRELSRLLGEDGRFPERRRTLASEINIVKQHLYRIRRQFPWMLEPNPMAVGRTASTVLTDRGCVVVLRAMERAPKRGAPRRKPAAERGRAR